MTLGWGLLLILVCFFIYAVFIHYNDNDNDKDKLEEGFYPRRWWWGGGAPGGWRWGWRRPWLRGWGNWRPYGYYPSYSGYWQQCPSGSWCPATMSCASPACN